MDLAEAIKRFRRQRLRTYLGRILVTRINIKRTRFKIRKYLVILGSYSTNVNIQ